MKKIIVVNNPKSFPLQVEGVDVVAARTYLTAPELARLKKARVFNLCREYRYQSRGYYVSLLAEARGHTVIPSVKTIQDLKTQSVVRILSEELEELIQRSLRQIRSEEFTLSIYFGENLAKQHRRLSIELHKLFQAPFLRARFARDTDWTLRSVRAIAWNEIPEDHLEFVQEAAQRYFSRTRYHAVPAERFDHDLAILVNRAERFPPSNRKAIDRFVENAQKLGFSVELIGRDDYSRIGEFDALFLRETTSVDHHTYRFARRAQSEGMAVIDDPDSILRCSNKVYLAEVLQGAGIPTPRTLVVHTENVDQVAPTLGLPCVLKVPDSSFSHGVRKAETLDELTAHLATMLSASDLVIAQAYTPTDFDWRIGVLDGEPLFACRYFMARGHWQIYNWAGKSWREREGNWETMPLEDVSARVVAAALGAAELIGRGLYGVDVKEVDGEPLVIEVNDNPNIDSGVEDALLGEELYVRIIQALKDRVEARVGGVRGR